MPELDPQVLAYYEQGKEAGRLLGGAPTGRLELERTKELIAAELPTGPLRVLDVGGGAGVYAEWLASLGHQVALIDPVPLHVEQAVAAGLDASVGDARRLEQPDASADVVLLLGPLYHLPDRDDRRAALAEARRVLRPGGWLFAAGISRYSALLDLLVRADRLHEPGALATVAAALDTGVFLGADAGLFTTAYFHRSSELRAEVADAGFTDARVRNIEGPGFMVSDLEERWADPARREALLEAARLADDEPELVAAAGHLLATARRPPSGSDQG